MSMGDNAATATESNAAAVCESAKAAASRRETSGALWARFAQLLFLVTAATVLAGGMIDSVSSWKIRRNLSGAAEVAAKVAISTPLTAKNCDGTPCSIESAAAAAKTYLINAGYRQASCIDPQKPRFSGVLVWLFSCGPSETNIQATGLCDTYETRVCVKIDMTPVKFEADGKMVGYTRATVQYPHVSVVGLILTPLPERLRPRMAKSVAGDALLRDSF